MRTDPQEFFLRMRIAVARLRGKNRGLPWQLLVRDVFRSSAPGPLAEVVVLEQDDSESLVHLQIGEFAYWYPAEACRHMLSDLHCEVFHPGHGHFYEYGGAILKTGDAVLDAGASEGFFTRYALQRGARVVAVEPWSRMIRCLERTFAEEIRDGRVQVVRGLLGNAATPRALTVNLDFAGASSARPESLSARMQTESVPVLGLDELAACVALPTLDFLKMDIEGSEREALLTGKDTFQKSRPRFSITCYHQGLDREWMMNLIGGYVPEYCFACKGIFYTEPIGWGPLMLHGWVGELLP